MCRILGGQLSHKLERSTDGFIMPKNNSSFQFDWKSRSLFLRHESDGVNFGLTWHGICGYEVLSMWELIRWFGFKKSDVGIVI